METDKGRRKLQEVERGRGNGRRLEKSLSGVVEGSCKRGRRAHNSSQQQFTIIHNNSQQFTTVHNSSLFYIRKPECNSGVKKPDAS